MLGVGIRGNLYKLLMQGYCLIATFCEEFRGEIFLGGI
jgi:hypothetical protein